MPQETYSLQYFVPVALFLAAVVALFWWIIVRPEKKRARDHFDLIRNLKPGDKVVTAGGIHGAIVAVRERTVEIQVADRVVLTFDKYAVRKRQ